MCDCGTPCGCGSGTIPQGPRGNQGVPGPVPLLTFYTTPLPTGTSPTVFQTGGPIAYDITIGIPAGATGTGTAGADGTDGVNAYTQNVLGFQIPALGSTVTLTVGENSWIQVGQWLFIEQSGYFIVTAVGSNGSITVRNPGAGDGYPSGVNGQTAPGTVIGSFRGVSPGGVPGVDGAAGGSGSAGAAGAAAEILVQNTVPVSAPAPGRSSVIVTDSSTDPTFTVIYTWNGSAWVQTANIQGAAGSQIVNTAGDPNSTLPSPTSIGDYAIRTDIPGVYVKTGASTWTFVVSLTPTFTQVATASSGNLGTLALYSTRAVGFQPRELTHAFAGGLTLDLSYQYTYIDAAADITLAYNNLTFDYSTTWYIFVTNTDGSAIDLDLSTGDWNVKDGLVIPATIAPADVQALVVTRSPDDKLLVTDTFLVTAW